MEFTQFITDEQREVLAQARVTYGYQKQLSVCSEELNELSIVCNKHCRYDTPEGAAKALHDEALTEVADVLNILDHVINIFGLEEEEIREKVADKIARLNRWMNKTDSLEQSTIDRELDVHDGRSCDTCIYKAVPSIVGPCKDCGPDLLHYRKAMACKNCVNFGKFTNLSKGGVCQQCMKDGGSQYRKAEGAD